MTNRKQFNKHYEDVLERGVDLIAFYHKNPCIAAYDLLGVDFPPIQRLVFEDMWFKNYVIATASRGFGKSNDINSLTHFSNKGLVYLHEELPPIPSYLKDGEEEIIDWDEEIYTSEGFRQTKSLCLEKGIEGKKIVTQNTFTQKGSNHHPLLILNSSCEFQYKSMDEFESGDKVCIQRGQNIFGNDKIPIDDAYILGLFVGGILTLNDVPKDKTIKSFCTDYCIRYNISYKESDGNISNIFFKEADKFFEGYKVNKVAACDKSVPYSIRTATRESQIAFLQGYFDTNGAVNSYSGNVSCYSVSKKFLHEIQLMLLNFGIVSTVRVDKIESKFGRVCMLNIYSEDARKFKELIGFRIKREQEVLDDYFDNKVLNDDRDTVPYVLQLCQKIIEFYNTTYTISKKPSFSICANNKEEITYSELHGFLVQCREVEFAGFNLIAVKGYIDRLRGILDYNYYFDTVVSVDDWCGDCYDFEMDMETSVGPNYFSSGFINHNTFMLGTLAALSCMLRPGYRVGLIAPVFRQSFAVSSINSSTYGTFWTTSGMVTGAENMYNSTVPNVTQIQSKDDQNTILSKWKNDERACINIKTTKGFEMPGSIDHSVLSLNKNNKLVYKELQDIKDDDYLVVKTDFDYFGNNNSMPEFNEFEHGWRTKDCHIPKELTIDLSYWMGLLVGDGCVSISKDKRKQRVNFVNEDQDLLDAFENNLRKYFCIDKEEKISRRNRKNNTWEIEYYCKKLVNYLLKCGFTKTTALDKKIPHVLKKASRDNLIAFLQAVYDTDGCVYTQKGGGCEVSFSTSSIQLAKEVQSILLNIGIVSNLSISNKACIKQLPQGNKPSKCAEAYKIIITGQTFLKRFNKVVGFRCCRKKNKLTDYLKNHFKCKENLSVSIGLPRSITNRDPYAFESFLIQGLYFVKVKEVDYFFSDTVDIEVADEHCYWANGFINHNSKMIFSEVEKLYSQSSVLREACERRPIRGSDTCFLKFKSVAGMTPSFIEALPLSDGCVSARNYLTFSNRFGKINDAHSTDTNHYIDRSEVVWGNGKYRESDRSLCNGMKDTIKIKTKKGFSNEGTPNHMFKVVRDSEVVWCRFDEMVVGDRVLIDRSYRWHEGNVDVTEEQAYAFGFLLGDGCWTDRSACLSVATLDTDIIPVLNKGVGCTFKQLADGVHYVAKNNTPGITNDTVRKNWLSFWDMPVSYAIDKKFPKKILSSSRNIMSKCISGLLDADGHISVSTAKGGIAIAIGFTNTSEELINQLHYILLHYGIVAVKIEREKNENWNTVYDLLITGSDVKIFYDKIGFGLKRKQDILEAAVNNKTRWVKSDTIPGIRHDMIRISESNRVRRGDCCVESRYCKAHRLKSKKEVNQYLADCFIKTYGYVDDPAIGKIKELSNPDIYYDEIVSVGEGSCVTYDIHIPDGNEYCANGFFSHNSKIRGSRFYSILIDELAQVPDQVLDMVIRPMAATSLAPMERVHRLEQQKRLISLGLASVDDFEEEVANKMVMTSSGYYKFNHMWRRMTDHWAQMEISKQKGEVCQYSVWQVPYWDLPEGFLDINNIDEARRVMSHAKFRMEYEAAMISDSEGFFKASLIDGCMLGSGHTIEMVGHKGDRYVIGVDPNQGGKASTGVIIIRVGTVSRLVGVLELKRQTTQQLTMAVQAICEKFNVIRIFMDKGGGGKAICDLLEEGYNGHEPIIDRTNNDHRHLSGRHILELVHFNPAWISDANFTTKAMLEDKKLLFPETPIGSTLDLEAKHYENVNTLKSQMLSIIVTQTATGILHFDTPTKGQNKDLYSALILAAHGVRMIEKELEDGQEPILHNSGGMIRPRSEYSGGFNSVQQLSQKPTSGVAAISAAVLKKKIK